VIVNRPNSEIGVDGCRRDHKYIGTNASDDERKGRLNSGASIWGIESAASDAIR
jgi:hypothetical protein